MIAALGDLARPWLAKLAPEDAHRATLAALRMMPALPIPKRDPRLAVDVFGLRFPHPLGLAAGFDKNALAPRALLRLGFGFVEVGTVTPRPQPGSPKPRLFRLTEDAALINRMGFNNDGYARARARLGSGGFPGIVGVNFGPNKDAADRIDDYVQGVKTFAAVASYLTINVSSPNTAALRDLQQRNALDELVARVIEARDAEPIRPPVLIKIAPDLDLRALDDIVSVAIARGADGLIISNTTISRPADLRAPEAGEGGGLSGRPVFSLSTRQLARAYLRCDGALPLIGAGGIEDVPTALAKIEAGAALTQIYTGMIYRGPGVIHEILDGLLAAVERRKAPSIGALVGGKAREFAVEG
jgi:dihydroorotate dehydrogenase